MIFPKEIMVVSTDEAAHLEKPQVLKIPVDLHETAEKCSALNASIQSILVDFAGAELRDKMIEAIETSQNSSIPWYTNYYTDDDLYIKDNVIQIDCEKGIIHKQKKLFSGVHTTASWPRCIAIVRPNIVAHIGGSHNVLIQRI